MRGNTILFHWAKYIEKKYGQIHWVKSTEKILRKQKILLQSIEKSFLIDPLNTNNPIYRDSLTLTP